jgi:hypothetical protein
VYQNLPSWRFFRESKPQMKKAFLSKQAKIIVDILMVLAFILLCIFSKFENFFQSHWKSEHCIIGVVWILLIIIHVAQHWRLIKSFTKKKIILRNKITAWTIFSFILIVLSVLFFVVCFNMPLLMFHNLAGKLFILMIVIHTIDKFKRFISLLKKN